MILKHAKVLNADFEWSDAPIFIQDGTITEHAVDETIDCQGCYAVPGLVDIHTHGCNGFDTMDGHIDEMAKFWAKNGTTTFLPTTATMDFDGLKAAMSAVASCNTEGAFVAGVHLEGPYFSDQYKGAQNPKYLRNPSIEEFEILHSVCKTIKIISLAPELPGAMDFIRQASRSVTVSLGHSGADYETAKAGFSCGASHVTHLFNGMPDMLHRSPNLVGAALENPDVTCEIICDGIHVHPAIVRLIFNLLGDRRMVLISDSLMATGVEHGEFSLCGQKIYVKNGSAVLGNGSIAGSTVTLLECVRRAVSFGIPLASAVRMASLTPAKVIGLDGIIGSIVPGKRADILLLDENLQLKQVILAGKIQKI